MAREFRDLTVWSKVVILRHFLILVVVVVVVVAVVVVGISSFTYMTLSDPEFASEITPSYWE